jgi:hypothetical protein
VKYALEWGMLSFEETESERPDFHTTEEPLNLVGKPFKYIAPNTKKYLLARSFAFVLLLCATVICTTSFIYYLKYLMDVEPWVHPYSGMIASMLNAFQIQAFTYLFGFMAKGLTDWENHR